MQWIYFVGGRSNKDNSLATVGLGMAEDPEAEVLALEKTMPFPVELLGLEVGSLERFERLKERFKALHSRGCWYLPGTALRAHIDVLEPVDRSAVRPKRVSLDLTRAHFQELEEFVDITESVTKQRFLRRAYKAYGKLGRYVAQGFKIQALKDGRLVQFEDLDHIPDP